MNHSEELKIKNGLLGLRVTDRREKLESIHTFPNAVVPVPEAGPSGGARSETNLNEYELCGESKQTRVG